MSSRKDLANALRFLAIDAIEKAHSGHPGAPMGMADMAEALWRGVLKHNPANPHWADRDRFVLSNGHASMLLYGLLHLTGYDLSMDDIRQFRQFDSRTPGHPEYAHTAGVETTTGPLGQGFATAVGMALAESCLATQFNKPDLPIVDHHTYVFLGDGCMMEGISHEAASLAGTLGLNKLIALYDANGISIDGHIQGWFGDDTPARFKAYGWQVLNVDGHDNLALDAALVQAKAESTRPTLIYCHTHIGYGAPHKADSQDCHGSPLGAEESAATRQALGWTAEPFEIPTEIRKLWDCRARGDAAETAWKQLFSRYQTAYPELAAEFTRRMNGDLPADWTQKIQKLIIHCNENPKSIASRIASRDVLNELGSFLPELFGGSADLTGSVGTWHTNSVRIQPENFTGNYLSYGVREFAMGAMMNGLTLHGGLIPYAGTFMVFSDYARNAIRLSALMGLRVIWILTHDSIGLGEDGPTHQPIEQLASLRLIPNNNVWRPADTVETAVAWKCALENREAPSCLSLSRQNLPFIERSADQIANIERGAYIVQDCAGTPELILMATGSELHLALEAAQNSAQKHQIRVVSMPCAERFEQQDAAWKEYVLPAAVRTRIAIEAGIADWWYKYTGLDGAIIGMDSFGKSAPAPALFEHFGFTVKNVLEQIERLLAKQKK